MQRVPTIKKWELEVFPFGNFVSDRIDFSIDDHNFFMVFTPIKSFGEEYLTWMTEIVGLNIPDNSYTIKFDRLENFESGDFYAPPSDIFSKTDYKKLNRLGNGIRKLIKFHYSLKNTELYFASAESFEMKKYYDRLIRNESEHSEFEVISNIGEEGLDYAIKTPNYKDQNQKNGRYAENQRSI